MGERRIRVDPHAEAGAFDGWGTSLAWWANAFGRLPAAQRDPVLRRLFSLDDGGLGLTVVRFNAGGGENPAREVSMEARAVMDGYRAGPGIPLDETADAGQRAVLRDAARIAAEEDRELIVEVFGNSPPWWATRSGSVTGAFGVLGRAACNLNPDYARDYLDYLSDVARFIEHDAGVRIASISPFNEPTAHWWRLGGRQEGCHFHPRDIDFLLRQRAAMGDDEGKEAPLVAASEEWSLGQARRTWDALGPEARAVVGRLNVHTYAGETRAAVRSRAARAGIALWVSEYGEGEPTGWTLASGITRDLRELAPRAWVLWQALSHDAWGLLHNDYRSAKATPTPKFEVFARFTRAIRPGMRLVGTDDPLSAAAIGEGLVSLVVTGSAESDDSVRIEVLDAKVLSADVEMTKGALRHGMLEPESDGALRLTLPANCVAGVVMRVAVQPDTGRFGGSGTWWIAHEDGSRLGLRAEGESELRAGVRVVGVSPDDSALAQRWRAEACGDGSVRLVCEASGNELSVAWGSKRAGAKAIQAEALAAEHAPEHHRFRVKQAEDGGVELRGVRSGLALGMRGDGAVVQLADGEPAECWTLSRVGTRRDAWMRTPRRRMLVRRLARRVPLLLVVVAVLLGAAALVGCAQPDGRAGGSAGVVTEPAEVKVVSARVERVVDGDTAVLWVEGKGRERVRFIGVDTPESTNRQGPYGKEASAYTKRLLRPGKQVWLEYDAELRDTYERLLAYVWLERPASASDSEVRAKMLNAKLALEGYAQQMTIPPNVRYAESFGEYVREAREAGLGLWAGSVQ